MKQMIKIFVLICLLLPIITCAQPLYHYSQFDLFGLFGYYNAEVKEIYKGERINDFAPNSDPRLVATTTAVKESLQYKQEANILLRKQLLAKQDSALIDPDYVVLFPEYMSTYKIIVGIFPAGFEAIWQKEDGSCVYVLHRTDGQKTGFISLSYHKPTGTIRRLTKDDKDIRYLYDVIFTEVEKYIAKK